MPRARDETLIAAFAVVLAGIRIARGLTQEALAHEAGVDRTFVGLLETGKRQPTLSVIFALARALGVRPEKLIAETRSRMAG
ncbi:MAG TPA: helix-turn-helix transcriptional regulator [Steroidobacteraceae bacterium]|jgi:transcriptional regulator with XRE-family HTH domain|nr:helix-turn-helix transcriptional regulator [Steroidobacteraceae bacterium]